MVGIERADSTFQLDHFGLSTQNFESQLQFYTSTFNIVPTDFVYIEQDSQRIPITVFIHLDLVKEPVDHHAFFLGANSKKSLVHHCSFEVHDYDTQQLGHQ